MLHECPHGCQEDIGMSRARELHRCDKHGAVLHYTRALKSDRSNRNGVDGGTTAGENSQVTKAVSESRTRKRGMKRGKGFAASKEQREKVKGKVCVKCGDPFDDYNEQSVCDPAHLWPRGLGGCDNALCVIPLCRAHHREYDQGELDLLSNLIDFGYFKEMAHAIEAHELSPLTLLERTTGRTWVEADRSTLSGTDQTGGGTENSQVPKSESERETGEVAA